MSNCHRSGWSNRRSDSLGKRLRASSSSSGKGRILVLDAGPGVAMTDDPSAVGAILEDLAHSA